MTAPRHFPGRKGTVYAHIGHDGAVLYVGRTSDLDVRTKQHGSKPWWPAVAEVRVLHADVTHEQARFLERQEIEAHDPPNNHVFTSAWRERSNDRHGYVAYTHGCRCDECRRAKAAYIRERRRAAHEVTARLTTALSTAGGPWPVGTERHYVPDVKHGTSYAYSERGCRCLDCTQWKTVDTVERARRRKDRAA